MASLLAVASPAKTASLGMVLHAERAHIGEADASVGCTILEGDRLSTDAGGILRITISALSLQLSGQSSLVVGRASGSEGIILAQLASGNLVFSAASAGSIVIAANQAHVRPAANAVTVTHVRLVNRNELRIYAQRGALQFSYHGESETIPEGKTYRVILDPSEREVAALASDPVTKPQAKHRPAFILVPMAAAIAVGIAIPLISHESESPDRPGPPKKR